MNFSLILCIIALLSLSAHSVLYGEPFITSEVYHYDASDYYSGLQDVQWNIYYELIAISNDPDMISPTLPFISTLNIIVERVGINGTMEMSPTLVDVNSDVKNSIRIPGESFSIKFDITTLDYIVGITVDLHIDGLTASFTMDHISLFDYSCFSLTCKQCIARSTCSYSTLTDGCSNEGYVADSDIATTCPSDNYQMDRIIQHFDAAAEFNGYESVMDVIFLSAFIKEEEYSGYSNVLISLNGDPNYIFEKTLYFKHDKSKSFSVAMQNSTKGIETYMGYNHNNIVHSYIHLCADESCVNPVNVTSYAYSTECTLFNDNCNECINSNNNCGWNSNLGCFEMTTFAEASKTLTATCDSSNNDNDNDPYLIVAIIVTVCMVLLAGFFCYRKFGQPSEEHVGNLNYDALA